MERMSEPPSGSPAPHGTPCRSSWRERAFVLGGIALAAPATAILLVLDADRAAVGFVWSVAIAWTAAASLATALRCGIVDRDWSAFGGRACRHAFLPDTRAERFDWDTRTGAFAYMRIRENRERLLEDDGPRNHDAGI